MKRVGIIGASGYTGAELLRLSAQHPDLEVVYATGDSQAGTLASGLYPSLAARYPDLVFEEFDAARAIGLDVVFLGLPHEASMSLAPQLHGKVGCVVDLSAAFRLKEATMVATPGCHVTAATLALAPLVEAGVIEPTGVIVNSITGVSGAGRALKHTSMFCTVDEDVTAYGLLDHRHTPEIEQETGAQVLFTPHLAPLSRGLLATCYARPKGTVTTSSLLATLAGRYSGEPFVVVRPASPSTKAAMGSNVAHITARFDERTNTVISICAIDNLAKGASGGAVQAANVALGLSETAGLATVGLYP